MPYEARYDQEEVPDTPPSRMGLVVPPMFRVQETLVTSGKANRRHNVLAHQDPWIHHLFHPYHPNESINRFLDKTREAPREVFC
jgi:hypothetical protein